MRTKWIVLAVWIIIIGAPSAARADGFFTPFLGLTFGGSTGVTDHDLLKDKSRFVGGFAIGGMVKGVMGLEFDFGYAPNFYGLSSTVKQTNVMTAMGNLIVGIPIGGTRGAGVRPYISGGVGVIRRDFDFGPGLIGIQNTDFGFDLGIGLNIYVGDHFGLRGDVRHFRTAKSDGVLNGADFGPDAFNFTRATAGIVVRF